jgi:hypothetical protein
MSWPDRRTSGPQDRRTGAVELAPGLDALSLLATAVDHHARRTPRQQGGIHAHFAGCVGRNAQDSRPRVSAQIAIACLRDPAKVHFPATV